MKSRRQRLALERLEDRTLMSTCHVTRLSDTVTASQSTDPSPVICATASTRPTLSRGRM